MKRITRPAHLYKELLDAVALHVVTKKLKYLEIVDGPLAVRAVGADGEVLFKPDPVIKTPADHVEEQKVKEYDPFEVEEDE